MAKKYNLNLVKPSIPTHLGENCQFEIYSKESNAMTVCNKPILIFGTYNKTHYGVCEEHYKYLESLGRLPKEKKVKK